MRRFKFIAKPEQYVPVMTEKSACAICGKTGFCSDGGLYHGETTYPAFCLDCIADGGLAEKNASAFEGDLNELKHQLMTIHPELTADDAFQRAMEKERELQYSTPWIPRWQEWEWPAHCGDFCRLIQLAGQEDFNRLAPDGNGLQLFSRSLKADIRDITDAGDVWNALKPGAVNGITDPQDNWSTMAYIFQCLHCGEYVSIWDCC